MNRKQRRAQAKAERRKRKVLPYARRVDPWSITPNETIHHPPNPAWRPAMERLSRVFDEHDPKTPDAWELGFRKDLLPEREIAIWLRLADAYEALLARRRYRRAERHDLYRIVVSLSIGARPREILASLTALPADEAESLLGALVSGGD